MVNMINISVFLDYFQDATLIIKESFFSFHSLVLFFPELLEGNLNWCVYSK